MDRSHSPRGMSPPAAFALALIVAAMPCMVSTASALGQLEDGPPSAEAEVPRDKAGEAALTDLSKARSAAYKHEAEEREALLVEVAEGYRALAETVERGAAVRAEAAFRGGEILRARKRLEDADALFARAAEIGKGGPGAEFAARGLLERGHIRRRAKTWDEALRLYAQVLEGYPEQRRSAAHALTWTGKVHQQVEDLAAARTAVLRFADEYAEAYPVEAIRNAERLSRALVSQGDVDAARAISARIHERMATFASESGEETPEIHEALEALAVTLDPSAG